MNNKKVIGFFVLILFLSIPHITAQKTGEMVTGPSGEEIEGDPDQAIITGRIVNPEETPEPEATGIEHEDIGIAEPEPTLTPEPTGIDDDDFGLTIDQGSPTPAPGAPEIDDEVIVAFEHGEKEDSEENGGVRFGDAIRGARPAGENESYKVVVRGWDYKDKKAARGQYSQTDLDFILERSARDVVELEEYSTALAQSDANIQQIILTESTIVLDYRHPAKLLGIINIEYTYHAEVDELGRLKTKLPWWLFLTRNNADRVTADLEKEVGGDSQLQELNLRDALQKQQLILQTMSNVMKNHNDMARSIIQNIRA